MSDPRREVVDQDVQKFCAMKANALDNGFLGKAQNQGGKNSHHLFSQVDQSEGDWVLAMITRTRHFHELETEALRGRIGPSVIKTYTYSLRQHTTVLRSRSARHTYIPCVPVGGACAIREKSPASPMLSRIRHVRAHIITPAPISLNWPADSYNLTSRWGYFESATARQRPPIPPPLYKSESIYVFTSTRV